MTIHRGVFRMFKRTAFDDLRCSASPGIPDEPENSLINSNEARSGTVIEFHPVTWETALSHPHQDS
jgi:hypothetical protein